jgi:hypothetical protein
MIYSKEIGRATKQPLFSFPGKLGIWGDVKDFWVCWDNQIALIRHQSWLGRLFWRRDEPSWGPAFYNQIEDVRVVPHLGTDQDELVIVFKNATAPLSLRASRKNVEFVRSIILPRLNVR